MAKIEPGAYKTSDDRVFDDTDDGDEEEGSRLPLLIVIALLVLAAFGGVVWLAYNQGEMRGRNEAPRPLVAETGGGSPNKAIKVYEQPAPADPDAGGDSDSVPAPPTETAKAPAAMAQATPKPTPVTTAPVATAPPKPLIATPKPEAAPPAPAVVPKPVEQTHVEALAAVGDYVLQIGSYKSQDDADAAWKAFQHKHAMLAGYQPDVKKVDLADKGTWYRLRTGAFSKDAASAFCTKLKADGGDCLLAKK
jgi:cell division protein FtsN